MTKYVLGISAFYHDSAAALLMNGNLLAAAHEERFTRVKHDNGFPLNAIQYCLEEAGITIQQVDHVVFYEKPFIKFNRLLETYLTYAPRGIRSFNKAMPSWIKEKLWLSDVIKRKLGFANDVMFTEHHEAHAASAFYPSPFKRAAILTLDGVGEWTTTSYGIGDGNSITMLKEIKFPHSLGLLYSALTYYLGFKVNSGEYKVMGLAPYGEGKYVDVFLNNIIDIKDDGSFRLNMNYFNYGAGLTMTNQKFNNLFDGPPRKPESKLSQKDMDLAASVQTITEMIMLKLASHIKKETRCTHLCLAGGVALNCVANGKILRQGDYEDIWVQPAAGDAGGAVGAALAVWYHHLKNERFPQNDQDTMSGAYLGPSYSKTELRYFLNRNQIPYDEISEDRLPEVISQHLENGRVVGYFSGRMEFGPRALGSRSIIGDARNKEMQTTMNLKIKFRESFRPFAPSVLEDKVSNWFDLDRPSPYMLLVANVKKDKHVSVSKERSDEKGMDLLKTIRTIVPAITHVDYSARIHTVNKITNLRYYQVISKFFERTGCPVILNTSFNVRGEPIVCTPEDAYHCFMNTNMDFMALENFILDKQKMPVKQNNPEQKQRNSKFIGNILFRSFFRILTLLPKGISISLANTILGVFYYFALTPFSVFYRIFNNDPLRLKNDNKVLSYWENIPLTPKNYKQQY